MRFDDVDWWLVLAVGKIRCLTLDSSPYGPAYSMISCRLATLFFKCSFITNLNFFCTCSFVATLSHVEGKSKEHHQSIMRSY